MASVATEGVEDKVVMNSTITTTEISTDMLEHVDNLLVAALKHFCTHFVVLREKVKVGYFNLIFLMLPEKDTQQVEAVLVVSDLLLVSQIFVTQKGI